MSDLALLRSSLAPQYAGLPAEQIETLVQSIYGPGTSAEDVEGLFDDIGRGLQGAARGVGQFAQRAAPMVVQALPNAAAGAAGGAAFGPWGAVIGAGAGLASGLLQQSSNRTARGVGQAIHGAGSLVSTVRGGGAGGAIGSLASIAGGGLGGSAAGQAALGGLQAARGGSQGGAASMLTGLLARPELLQSLLGSLLGSVGRQSVNVGGQQVPVSQMLSALSNVAGRAAHEAAEAEGSAELTPEYALIGAEAFGTDPEDAEGRTDTLLTLLALTPSLWAPPRPPISVHVNPGDPYFPAGEAGWDEATETEWSGEDWPGEDWSGEDLISEDLSGEDFGSEIWASEDWLEYADD
ncbi:MAG: hypothetical protein J0M19_06225 [Sphingomonadales bacterium]|nr:hypothetical protein [Sphingomonadales bacterium]